MKKNVHPAVAVIVIAIVVGLVAAYYVWFWQQPGSLSGGIHAWDALPWVKRPPADVPPPPGPPLPPPAAALPPSKALPAPPPPPTPPPGGEARPAPN